MPVRRRPWEDGSDGSGPALLHAVGRESGKRRESGERIRRGGCSDAPPSAGPGGRCGKRPGRGQPWGRVPTPDATLRDRSEIAPTPLSEISEGGLDARGQPCDRVQRPDRAGAGPAPRAPGAPGDLGASLRAPSEIAPSSLGDPGCRGVHGPEGGPAPGGLRRAHRRPPAPARRTFPCA